MASSNHQKEPFNLNLTDFDLDVNQLNIYGKEKRIVANVNQVSCKKDEFFFVCLDISPSYTVNTVDGNIVKKRMLCRSSVFILVTGQAGRQLEEKWTSSKRKDCFVVTFIKKGIYKFTSKSGSCEVPCVVITTGGPLAISDSFLEYRQNNLCNLILNDLIFPEDIMKTIKSKDALTIFEIDRIILNNQSQEKDETIEKSLSLTKSEMDENCMLNPYSKVGREYYKYLAYRLPPVMIETTVNVRQIDSRGSFDNDFERKWSTENL